MERDETNMLIKQHKQFNCMLKNGSGDMHHQTTTTKGWFEIRLFYVRITPCDVTTVPEHLKLRNLCREIGISLEINGIRVPSADPAMVTLRRDRVDKESSEVIYVSTDNIRVSGAVEFEVIDDQQDMVLCGSLERVEPMWSKGDCGSKPGWSMGFYAGNLSKYGGFAQSIEVYIAGCCASVPVILTKTIQVSPRRRGSMHRMLDAIPEDEEVDNEPMTENAVVQQQKLPHTQEGYEYESEAKIRPSYYSEEMYYDEDGQLTWFNAGVRVGVGIGLGMCLDLGIGVGLLMRSYQVTTRSFKMRFF